MGWVIDLIISACLRFRHSEGEISMNLKWASWKSKDGIFWCLQSNRCWRDSRETYSRTPSNIIISGCFTDKRREDKTQKNEWKSKLSNMWKFVLFMFRFLSFAFRFAHFHLQTDEREKSREKRLKVFRSKGKLMWVEEERIGGSWISLNKRKRGRRCIQNIGEDRRIES